MSMDNASWEAWVDSLPRPWEYPFSPYQDEDDFVAAQVGMLEVETV